ncbi:hypothetical protein H8S90_21110 [Olivibacter sp. SDN3]|uniref:hypothetical protein n=1 Tax=Olivibacter sp. SDN3 TaxID=2764720 RepID=UPI001650F077|nr:hypothetical protein [Olivibacter sp. SDN3]QNL49211.1 hypothetical protein H8S90_21110 [Olivibacter sp. SDN3]
MKEERSSGIVLKKLDVKEADGFLSLHNYPTVCGSYFEALYVKGESGVSFTQRLLWLSKCAYTIRLKSDPDKIIGACLIYRDINKGNQHIFGGTLLPTYRNKSLLIEAFNQIKELAKYCYGLVDLKINKKVDEQRQVFLPSTRHISVVS